MAVTAARRLDSTLAIDSDGELLIDGVRATELALRFGTPLHVISESRLRENYRRIRDAFEERWEAGVSVYFAIKSNPALAIRAILVQEGAWGDCLGLPELRASLVAGTPGERLVLNGNNKTDEAITAAVRCGARINVDDLDEPERLAAAARETGRVVEVGIRVKPDPEVFGDRRTDLFDSTVHRYIEISKWGLEPELAPLAVRKLLETPELRLTGLHCHIGRHFPEPCLFGSLARGLAATVARIRDDTGWSPARLSFGGGFTQGRDPFFRKPAPGDPWPRPEDDFVQPVEAYAEALCGELARELEARGLPAPVLELEPGRYITASAGLTLTRVGTVKQGVSRTWVEVDATITQIGSSRNPRDAHAMVVADGPEDGDEIICDVVGPLCVLDLIMEQGSLPPVRRGNLLAILDTGAYADGEASNANSIGRPAVALVSDADAEIIRRRETFGDVFVRDTIPPRLMSG